MLNHSFIILYFKNYSVIFAIFVCVHNTVSKSDIFSFASIYTDSSAYFQ